MITRTRLIICLSFLIFHLSFCTALAQHAVTGVPHWLAEARSAEISNVSYILHFNIPANRQEAVTGTATILFDLDEKQDVILDFQGKLGDKRVVNGVEREVEYSDEHIVIPKRFARKGNNVVELQFTSLDQALNRKDDYMYTLFVPDRARSVFPCFDQPELKAMFTVELSVPEGWKTITSCTSKPISTYLFSFVCGRFEEKTFQKYGLPVRILYRETDPKKVQQLEGVADLAARSVSWMETWTAMGYPFDSYALVILPGYQFGGMEHPGAIQLSDRRVFLGTNPTQDELLSRVELIAHETAHMWFGDLVTMRWFDDVWTKEVFANFMASKISRKIMPDVNHDLNFLKTYRQLAVSTDRTEGTHPIAQRLDNLNHASLLYGNIIYDKAPVVMQKLEEQAGEEPFQNGIRQYLQTYAYGNASWDDLIRHLRAHNPNAGLQTFSDIWVKKKGMPIIHTEYRNGKLVFTQLDPNGQGVCWPQKFEVMVGSDLGTSRVFPVRMSARKATTEISVQGKPSFIMPNYYGEGYGLFTLDKDYLHLLSKRLLTTKEELPRYALVQTLYDNYLAGNLKGSYFSELYRMMEKESSPLILSTVSAHMRRIAFDEKNAKDRQTLELCMLDLIDVNHSPACRQAIVHQLMYSATAPQAVNYLYNLWQRHHDPLFSERDYIQMAYHLAIMRPKEWHSIISTQRKRLKGDDLLREFDFVSRACTPSHDEQQKLFQQLLRTEEHEAEPWVQQALALLCQDTREGYTAKYITPALNILPELQQKGGIFFPSGWLSALLGWHKSQESRQQVQNFLRQHPDFPENLRRKIYEQSWLLMNGNR
ncbi:MAG: aminopeptidase [Prevotella sp.]|jgi:aminopeptidase N|nr:aminopeptidase [Prevotella sp.]